MNATQRFIKHISTVTSHPGATRKILDSKYWVVVLWKNMMFVTTTDMVTPQDEVLETGTHMQCVEYLTNQFTEVQK